MRKLTLLVLLTLSGCGYTRAPKPVWHEDSQRWTCPTGYEVYADERELVEGKNFVHCVK
jgi:hypothetical protein